MMTENLYNYRMDYSGLYTSKNFHYPITPPYTPNAYDTTPAQPLPSLPQSYRSAFSAVISTSGAERRALIEPSAAPLTSTAHQLRSHHPYNSADLLQQFYAQQAHKPYYANYFNASPTLPAVHYPLTAAQGVGSVAMIEQLLRRPLAPSVDASSSGSVGTPSASSTASSSPFQEPDVIISDDTDCEEVHDHDDDDCDDDEEDADDDDDEVICVDDDHMDRQCREMIQRTTVIKAVIADDLYLDEQQRLNGAGVFAGGNRVRGSMQRQSSDSASSATSLMSLADDEIVCKWSECFRHFATLEQLATHVTHTHAIASPAGLYYCQWHHCPRSERGFNARYKMLVHVRTHTKEKPHRCQQCDKSFSRAENLKIHTRSHSGEKPYVCPVAGCKKAYSNSSDRFKHTRTHSTEKPYMCKVAGCNKRYTDPSSLRKHVKTFKHSAHLTTFEDMVKPFRMMAPATATAHPADADASAVMLSYSSSAPASANHYNHSNSTSATVGYRLMDSGEMIDLSPPESLRYEPLHGLAVEHRLHQHHQEQPTTTMHRLPHESMLQHLDALMLHDAQHLHSTVAESECVSQHSVDAINDAVHDHDVPLDLSMGSNSSF